MVGSHARSRDGMEEATTPPVWAVLTVMTGLLTAKAFGRFQGSPSRGI